MQRPFYSSCFLGIITFTRGKHGTKRKGTEKFRRNPKNVRFEDIDHLLIGLGFAKRFKGSHATYTLGIHRITIPFRRPYVLPIYVKNVLALLDALEDSAESWGNKKCHNLLTNTLPCPIPLK